MALPKFIPGFLLAICFTLAIHLELSPGFGPDKYRSGSVLDILMGDSKRLFANHFVTKADAYFHNGAYPSFFDQAKAEKKSEIPHSETSATPTRSENSANERAGHLTDSHETTDKCEHEEGFLEPARDWIDAFGRNFFPTVHTHADEKGDQREILPWLRWAADLNPNDVKVYTLSAHWLRRRMGKVNEAEEFLREGWRTNPDSYEIALELALLYEEARHEPARAQALLEIALRK